MNEFVPFQSFFTEEEAMPVIQTLKENNIEYSTERFGQPLDATIAGDVVQHKFFLKIRSQDFPKANKALDKVILDNISSLDKDYYLFSFTNAELFEIIKKPDEWSRQDFLIANKILNDRGAGIPREKINQIKSNRIKELAKPEPVHFSWILVGYALALAGGIVAFLIALPFVFAKKTLPDGSRIYIYNTTAREHGRNIAVLASLVIIVNLFLSNVKHAFIGFFDFLF